MATLAKGLCHTTALVRPAPYPKGAEELERRSKELDERERQLQVKEQA